MTAMNMNVNSKDAEPSIRSPGAHVVGFRRCVGSCSNLEKSIAAVHAGRQPPLQFTRPPHDSERGREPRRRATTTITATSTNTNTSTISRQNQTQSGALTMGFFTIDDMLWTCRPTDPLTLQSKKGCRLFEQQERTFFARPGGEIIRAGYYPEDTHPQPLSQLAQPSFPSARVDAVAISEQQPVVSSAQRPRAPATNGKRANTNTGTSKKPAAPRRRRRAATAASAAAPAQDGLHTVFASGSVGGGSDAPPLVQDGSEWRHHLDRRVQMQMEAYAASQEDIDSHNIIAGGSDEPLGAYRFGVFMSLQCAC